MPASRLLRSVCVMSVFPVQLHEGYAPATVRCPSRLQTALAVCSLGEHFEDVRELGARDARSGVGDRNDRLAVPARGLREKHARCARQRGLPSALPTS